MMMKRILLLMASLAALVPASAQYSFNGELLDRLAEAYRKGDPRAVKAVEEVEGDGRKKKGERERGTRMYNFRGKAGKGEGGIRWQRNRSFRIGSKY